jgi:tRNA(Ile)-lysidine synthase
VVQQPFLARVVPRIAELVRRVRPAVAGAGSTGLVVALSGGPDSVALLLAARAWAETAGAPLLAAHLNHRLRGAEADADEAFCRELCDRLAVSLEVERCDPRPLARQRGLGLEEAGRALRLQLLERLLDGRPELGCAATGHHRDDQAETVVMRLFRGTGLDGLRGIAPVSGRIIHPLLEVSRREIVAFLEDGGHSYRIDATNESGDAIRTRVRRELLPLARDIFGNAEAGPARLADLAAQDLQLLENLAREALAELRAVPAEPENAPDRLELPVAPLLALDPALSSRVLRLFLREHGGLDRDLARTHVRSLLDWLPGSRSGGTLDLPHGWRAVREFDRLRFLPPPAGDVLLSHRESYRILVTSHNDEAKDEADQPVPPATTAAPWRIRCPADAVHGRLRLRAWRPGDRIVLPGLDGHKKVSDLLQERRIRVSERPEVLVVEDDEGLIWVVGVAAAARTRLLPGTERTLTIAVTKRNVHDDSRKGFETS